MITYTGSGSCNLLSYDSEFTVLPPPDGNWLQGVSVCEAPDPFNQNDPTEYRCTASGAPGTWAGDNTLGAAVP